MERPKMAATLRKEVEEIRAEGIRLGLLSQPEVPTEYIAEVAADRGAMLDALAEFGFRMVMERGAGWELPYRLLIDEATAKIHDKLRDEIKSKQGACR